MKDLVHAPAWHKTMLTLQSVEKADINGDGSIDLQDIIALSNIMSNFADLTGDRVVNESDVLRMKDMVYFASLDINLTDIEMADISGPLGDPDGRVDNYDLTAITEGLTSYKDINGDGRVDEEDVALISALKTLGLNTGDIRSADVDGNGIVNDADLDILTRVLDYNDNLTVAPWQQMEFMDKVLEWLTLSAMTVEDTGHLMDVNGDGTVDVMDMHKISETLRIIRDVNLDGVIERADCDRILQIIGPDRVEQLITAEQIKRANIDGVGTVSINDFELINSLYDRLRKGDITGDGIVDDGAGVTKDTGAMQAIIQYNQLLADWGISEENMAAGDLNGNGKVDAGDLFLYETAYDVLYSTNIVNTDGVNTSYPAADFNYDSMVDSYDREYLEVMINKIEARRKRISTTTICWMRMTRKK